MQWNSECKDFFFEIAYFFFFFFFGKKLRQEWNFLTQKYNQNYLMLLLVPFAVVLCLCPSLYKKLDFDIKIRAWNSINMHINFLKNLFFFCICSHSKWLIQIITNCFLRFAHDTFIFISFTDLVKMLILS